MTGGGVRGNDKDEIDWLAPYLDLLLYLCYNIDNDTLLRHVFDIGPHACTVHTTHVFIINIHATGRFAITPVDNSLVYFSLVELGQHAKGHFMISRMSCLNLDIMKTILHIIRVYRDNKRHFNMHID